MKSKRLPAGESVENSGNIGLKRQLTPIYEVKGKNKLKEFSSLGITTVSGRSRKDDPGKGEQG